MSNNHTPISGYSWIVINPNLLSGTPTVKGTRISVSQVLELLSVGMSVSEIARDYPGFPGESLPDVLKYAAQEVGKIGGR